MSPHVGANCVGRAARRKQRALSAIPPRQQQVLRRFRLPDSVHGMPRSARHLGPDGRIIRFQMRRVPFRGGAHQDVPRGESELRDLPHAGHRSAEFPHQIHRSSDSRGARQPAVPELTKEPMQENIFSRRHFLLAGGAGLTLLRGATQTARPTFEEVPPRPAASSGSTTTRFSRALPAGNHGPRLRLPRLRQRRLDGYLPGQQRSLRFLYSLQSRSATRSTRTIATARSPTSPRRPASRAAPSAWAWPSATTTTTAFPTCS